MMIKPERLRKGNKVAYVTGTALFGIGALLQAISPNIILFIIISAWDGFK